MTPLTKSQVRKAGDYLRRQLRSRDIRAVAEDPANAEAWTVVRHFRRSHSVPTAELAHLLQQQVPEAISVSTRIKRSERVIEKIARGSTALDRLQDIGGCRLVVPDLADQDRVVARLRELLPDLVDVDDYVTKPKGSGYRAVHLTVRTAGVLIEVQVRTEVQHHWAVSAERAEQITGHPLKFGDAPADLLDYFRVASKVQAIKEHGSDADVELTRELSELRERIRRYYRRNG